MVDETEPLDAAAKTQALPRDGSTARLAQAARTEPLPLPTPQLGGSPPAKRAAAAVAIVTAAICGGAVVFGLVVFLGEEPVSTPGAGATDRAGAGVAGSDAGMAEPVAAADDAHDGMGPPAVDAGARGTGEPAATATGPRRRRPRSPMDQGSAPVRAPRAPGLGGLRARDAPGRPEARGEPDAERVVERVVRGPRPPTSYEVTLVSATFPRNNRAAGLPWDAFNNPPDITVVVTHRGRRIYSGFGGQDRFEARFDRNLGRLDVSPAAPLVLAFADRDLANHDDGGRVTLTSLSPGSITTRTSLGVEVRLRVRRLGDGPTEGSPTNPF